jgi:shikimate dehydrogenase
VFQPGRAASSVRSFAGDRPADGGTPVPAAAGRSVLAGLIGAGIQGSRSPAMHEREGERQGLRYVYKLIDLDRLGLDASALPELLVAAERLGFAGLNITHPCKQAVVAHLDRLAPAAAAIGAVNTVVFGPRGRVGHNTDSPGFAESFRREIPDARRELVLQVGAGGAGAAVAHALLGLGCRRLALFDADPGKAEALAASLAARFGAGLAQSIGDPAEVVRAADGLVNTTPVGMAKYPGLPIDGALLHPALWVADVVYFPIETELIGRARACGCRTLTGAGMAVFQAAEAFRLFTGVSPDPDRMLRHFDEIGAGSPRSSGASP